MTLSVLFYVDRSEGENEEIGSAGLRSACLSIEGCCRIRGGLVEVWHDGNSLGLESFWVEKESVSSLALQPKRTLCGTHYEAIWW